MRGDNDALRLSTQEKIFLLAIAVLTAKKTFHILNRGEIMKLDKNCKEWTVSQSHLARILEVSHQRVNQLIEEEVVVRDESSKSGGVFLIESLRNYYLSKNTVKDNESGSVNFWKEKGLHERAKRQMAELKLRVRKGELYEASIVEAVMTEQLVNFRNKLLGIPAKFATRLEGKSRAEINDALTEEIENCLDELSKNYKNANFSGDDDEEQSGVDDDDVESDRAT